MGIEILQKHIREKRAIIVAAGDNYDKDFIIKLSQSAQKGRASAVEIPCDKQLLEIARKNTKLPIIASSIHPFELKEALNMGFDGINIGNFYPKNNKSQLYNANEIYDIILEAIALINDYETYKIVTIPAYLNIKKQIELIKKIELFDINAIEIYSSKKALKEINLTLQTSNENSKENILELIQNTAIPIINGNEIDSFNSKMAFDNGADGVSLQTSLANCETQIQMTMEITKSVATVSNRNSFMKELITTKRELKLNI